MSKPFPPTHKRLDKARGEGKVLRSQIVMFSIGISTIGIILMQSDPKTLLALPCTVNLSEPGVCMKAALTKVLTYTLTLLGPAAVMLIVGEGLMVGFRWKRAKKNFTNPLIHLFNGMKSIPIKILQSLPFIALLVYGLIDIDLMTSKHIEHTGKVLLLTYFVALLIVGMGELLWNRRKLYKDLSMSFEEMKEEMKDSEGDPFVKAERRALHRHLTFEKAVAKIRQSKVVIVE